MTVAILPVGRKHIDRINDSVVFKAHQIEGVRKLYKMQSFLLADEMRLGKGQVETSPVLTPTGWTAIGKLEVGDKVIGSDGKACAVTGVFHRGELPVYRITFSDGFSLVVDGDHLWQVRSAGGAELVLSTREMNDPNAVVERDAVTGLGLTRSYTMKTHFQATYGSKWRIPLVPPVTFEPSLRSLPIDPYTLGVILGDGSISQRGRVQMSTDAEILDSLSGDWTRRPHPSEGIELAHSMSYCSDLIALGLQHKRSWDKFVPEQYLRASVEDRRAMLAGLIDTDGHPMSRGGVEFSSTSEQLCDDVIDLVRSLGGIARNKSSHVGSYRDADGESVICHESWRVNLKLMDNPFRLTRKAEKWIAPTKFPPIRQIRNVEPAGRERVVCISVDAPDRLYVADGYVVTHNSVQSLAVAAIDFQAGIASRMLIVSPASVKWNWAENEIDRHTTFTRMVLDGTAPQRKKQLVEFVESGTEILIANYEQVKAHLAEFNLIGFDIVILDEAHYIKGHKSARTKACQSLAARRFMLLTGSPMLNHVDDLWSLLHRIAPAEFPRYFAFLNRYAVYGGYEDKSIVGVKNERELNARLAAYMLRRERKDVLGRTNEKERIPILVELHPEQKKLYDEAKDELKITLPDNPNPMELENALTKMLRLKQITGTTACIEGYDDHSSKLDVAVEKATELIENGERVVVFTQFREVLACMERRVGMVYGAKGKPAKPDKRIPTYVLHGDVPQRDRVGVIRAWAENPKPGVLICMLQVAGVGLNMSAANTAIVLDKLWAPKLQEQAEDRLIDMEKQEPISIIEITARKTVEARVDQILRRKSELFGQIVQETAWKRRLLESIIDEEEAA